MKVAKDILFIGVNDHKIDLFEGQYPVKNGMSYNSFVIKDEKIAVMDTVDQNFTQEWLDNLQNALNGREPDYLIVQHMEPDHSANVDVFMNLYKKTVIVSSSKSFQMMKNYFGHEYEDRRVVVGEGSVLSLGKHNLKFIAAPMVHWPEVIVTYDETEKVLFSADAFGKFGALDGDEISGDWVDEARRYYIGIVGKYGVQVQSLLKKTAALDIQKICPLHGPMLNENLEYYLNLYQIWSSYAEEKEGVAIFYTSVYGHTKKAVEKLVKLLKDKNCPEVKVYDLARSDMSQAVADAFSYGKIVLATTTYNADIFPYMKEFINHLTERNFQNKTVGFIENGTWVPMAAKIMKTMLEGCKNLTFTQNNVKIVSAVNGENIAELESLVAELCNG